MRHLGWGTHSGLGYIVGERLEYRISPALFRYLQGNCESNVFGFCATSANDLAYRFSAIANWESFNLGYTVPPEVESEAKKVLADLISDHQKLRNKGVSGHIPVVIHPIPTGKQTNRSYRPMRRSIPIHEAFHADVIRAAHLARVGEYSNQYADLLFEELKDVLTDRLFQFSLQNWAAGEESHALEEILARIEEERIACLRSTRDCNKVRAHIQAWFMPLKEGTELFKDFVALRKHIIKKYGTPINAAQAAFKKRRA